MRDVILVGGGLAGLAAAALLAQRHFKVLLIEKGSYPQHRVCGEYLSDEVNPLLLELGVDVRSLNAVRIDRFQWWTRQGRSFEGQLGAGGFGISRYALDAALAAAARKFGVELLEHVEATSVHWHGDHFQVLAGGHNCTSRTVIASHGKRSKLDRSLKRASFARRSDYIAIKRHYCGEFPADLVALYGIPSGYCGVSRIEAGRVNVCYLTRAALLQSHGSIAALDAAVFSTNPELNARMTRLSPAMSQPLVVSQLDFGTKSLIEDHALMVGDAAGLIHPLCGNGMSMALHAARLATQACSDTLEAQLTRDQAERQYRLAWRQAFRQRRLFGRCMQPIMESAALSEVACGLANWLPAAAQGALQLSHGRSF